jgi:hypothetical protein
MSARRTPRPIREAIKHFEIKDPEQQRRLIAQRSD